MISIILLILPLVLPDCDCVQPRIVGGKPANISDYPFQVAILYNGVHKCGGTIIRKRFILTAAHCTNNVSESTITVRSGSSYYASGGNLSTVVKIHQHPKFNADTYDYDISILQLSKALSFGTNTAKIAMIGANRSISDGVMAMASGWGLLTYEGVQSKQLQVVSLPVINSCSAYYAGNISSNMFCAGYPQGGKDTCQGDSGGPLVFNGTLIGITSWGNMCGQPKYPGVFTKLSVLRSFVDSTISALQ